MATTALSTVTVRSITDYMKEISALGLNSAAEHHVFRGQDVKRNLLPGIARVVTAQQDSKKIEIKMLDELERIGATRMHNMTSTRLDLMILAQHFGLKTRLLDWTSNSLAALWFACSSKKIGDVYVYALAADDTLMLKTVPDDPFAIKRTLLIRPKLGNERIVAQHGCFTLHLQMLGRKGNPFLPLEKNSTIRQHLTELVIPARSREPLLETLEQCGINRSTLFPDLEGLCQYVNWKNGFESRVNLV
jgi:hypothetical protein